jgi:hypothetical protein
MVVEPGPRMEMFSLPQQGVQVGGGDGEKKQAPKKRN